VTPEVDARLRVRLEEAAGGLVREIAPAAEVAGARPGLRVEPRDADALGAVLAVLDATTTPAVIQGAGTKTWLGNPLRAAEVIVSTLGLAGIDELDEADGVVRVGAGTGVDDLARKAEAAGWLSPLDAPGRGGTVGGALATGLAGPRRPGFGPARDAVLGLDTVLADGSVTRCGARVVKNVTGYDLAKLYVGSLGTLGVIERAWLRLRPRPESVRTMVAPIAPPASRQPDEALGDAITFATICARRATARTVALLDAALGAAVDGLAEAPSADAGLLLVVELAGDAPAVDRDASRIAAERRAEETSAAVVEGLRSLQTDVAPIGVRARLHAVPSALPRIGGLLARGGGRLLVHPVPGCVTAWFEADRGDEEDPWWLDRVLGVVDEARKTCGADAVVEALPAWGRGRRDVFAGAPGLGVMRALKRRFDPNGILNPGRFAGSI
jgi:glycolate oxidase FAD binding subunit